MKATILGLAAASVAFGGSTVYFWHQLQEEKAQAEQVAEANRRLNARVAELEKAREELMTGRAAGFRGPFVAGVFTNSGPPTVANPALPLPPPPADPAAGTNELRAEGPGKRAEMPPAMVKMMRNQLRAQNKKTYFDLQEKLGLTDAQTEKMLDLLTEEQSMGFGFRHGENPEEMRAKIESERARVKNDMSEVLGSRTSQYEDYQRQMPSRMEVAMLADQFASADAPLSDDQRSRLITALAEERDRVPVPAFTASGSPEQSQKAYSDWQADYEERAAARARAVLNSEQVKVYEEYTQFQKEMREQMVAQGMNSLSYRIPPGTSVGATSILVPSVRMRAVPPPAVPPPQQSRSKPD